MNFHDVMSGNKAPRLMFTFLGLWTMMMMMKDTETANWISVSAVG